MKKVRNVFIASLIMVFSLLLFSCETTGIKSITVVGENVIEVGDEVKYTAIIDPSNETAEIVWSVIGEISKANIDENGNLNALEPGEITVKAKAGTVEGTLKVTIVLPLEDVSIDGLDKIYLGEDVQYDFVLEPENATYEEVSWNVLAGTGNATISEAGLLTPILAGTVTVRVTVDGIVVTKEVVILTPVESLNIIGPEEVRLGEDYEYNIDAEPENANYDVVNWEVVNGTGSATISEEGILTPVSAGTITLEAEILGLKAQLEIEVIKPVESVIIEGKENILPSDQETYIAIVTPEDAKYQDVVWSVVAETGDATITEEGLLTPRKSGNIKVVAIVDGVEAFLEVEIEEDDRLLGTPRPTHLLATPENTIFIDGEWVKETDIAGMDIEFARQVYDISFDVAASKSDAKVLFSIPKDADLSRMQYFALKVTGMTTTSGVNPTIQVNLKDFSNGLMLYNDQETEIEITEDNQWVIFQVSNRYRLQTSNRDLKIVVDPHFTASGNEGLLTIQRVVFFGDADPVTTPQLVTPFKTAHWESDPQFTAEPAVDEIDGNVVEVTKASATEDAVSGWKALPAYVLEDISRKTTLSFKVKLLTEDLTVNPKLAVYLGESEIKNVTIDRNIEGYQEITLEIPADKRTESNMWSIRYLQIKPNGGGDKAVEYYIYDLKLLGDANPTPIVATRTDLGGVDVSLLGSINYTENGTSTKVPGTEEVLAHVLLEPNEDASLSKLEFGYSKGAGNAAARAGLNGVYVKIQGTAGLEVNLQQGWGDGWADASEREFVLNGEVQEIYIKALNRSDITSGSGWFPFEFNVSIPSGLENTKVLIYDFAFTAILPEEEQVKDKIINFHNFIEGEDIIIDEEDIMEIIEHEEDTVILVKEDNENNHVVGVAIDKDIRYMNKLTIMVKGKVGAKIVVKLAYGNMYNYDEDYIHEFTTDDFEIIEIDIIDRDALKVEKISLSLFFDIGEETDVEFVLNEAYFSGEN